MNPEIMLSSDCSTSSPDTGSPNEISRYSSEEISGNESNEVMTMTEEERQADFNRQKEEMKRKRRKKKRTSSSMQSSTFKGELVYYIVCVIDAV